jgi:hypothetical protein
VPGSARLTMIMGGGGGGATQWVRNIELPDGRYTQTGGKTLKELFRIHFPDSTLTDDSKDGQGHRTWTYVNAQQ